MIKFFSIFLVLSFAFISCGSPEKIVPKNAKLSDPCNLKIILSGKSPEVQFKLFVKANEKFVTIDRQINMLDDKKDEFSISSYLGGKVSCELQTKDSYGPDVQFDVFVNGKLWQTKIGKYNPKLEGVIPSNF
tara:strand:+ start:234 stop:629 length:396 start_codon:yes stop_codon:yes gene_type:complete